MITCSPLPIRPGKNFTDAINSESLSVLEGCKLEASLADWPLGSAVQFERMGYFSVDPDTSADRLVFNRTMTLRDTWAKIQNSN